jgi:hypothetical protein
MSLILSGTDGLSDVDGSAATPAIRGTDANTGIFFPAADTIAFAEGGAEVARFDSSGNLGIGTSSPVEKLHVAGKIAVSGTNPSIRQTVQTANLDLCGGTTVGTDPSIQIFGSSHSTDANFVYYNSNSHVFRNSAGSTERARIDTSGNLQFNSGYGSVATAYGCRAWVNFNGTGTPARRANGNVSSITDNGTGDYTLNFGTALPDADFSCSAIITRSGNGSAVDAAVIVSQATTSLRIQTWWANFSAGGQFDPTIVAVVIFR